MRDTVTDRQVFSQGVSTESTFGISMDNTAHIMGILRNNIYSDKILAVLREYSANAWDSHRMSGKADIPIKIVMPTVMKPTLMIRDFGSGMSENDVLLIYTQYGASTKRNDDLGVGMLGIGSKSGFAYGDSFTVTSWFGGLKKVYVAVLDASDKGKMQKLHEEPCGFETGIEIQISVKPVDVPEFQRKARDLFPYFTPVPNINLELPKMARKIKQHGFFATHEQGWVAVMGCIPYKINIDQVKNELEEAGIWETLHKTHGGLYFDMCEVQFTGSREELRYTEHTKAALIKKFGLIVEAYIEDVLETLKDPNLNDWEKRSKAVFMENTLKINIPKRYKEWAAGSAPLWEKTEANKTPEPKTFVVLRESQAQNYITISQGTKLYMQDDTRPLKGFDLDCHSYIIRPLMSATLEVVRAELDEYLKAAKLMGIPIGKLSDRHWYKPHTAGRQDRGDPNPKHTVKSFRLKDSLSNTDAKSGNWDIESWEPADTDVFVILSYFNAMDCSDFYDMVRKDRAKAKMYNVPFPIIYGYKTTEAKSIKAEDCKGMAYMAWRVKFLTGLLTPELLRLASARLWDRMWYEASLRHRNTDKMVTLVEANLGTDHALTSLFKNYHNAMKNLRSIKQENLGLLDYVMAGIKVTTPNDPAIPWAAIKDTYPLLSLMGGLNVLAREDVTEVFAYFKLVDRDLARGGLVSATAA